MGVGGGGMPQNHVQWKDLVLFTPLEGDETGSLGAYAINGPLYWLQMIDGRKLVLT
jgi:hypothetical protein